MAKAIVTFVVDDISPTIRYSPFADTFGAPNVSAGWNPFFSSSGFATEIGEVGAGTSQHVTSLDGASMNFQWNGTGITLFGTADHATYNVDIDGSQISLNTASENRVLLNVTGLNHGMHNITLIVGVDHASLPAQMTRPAFSFDQAVVFSSINMINTSAIGFENASVPYDLAGSWSPGAPGPEVNGVVQMYNTSHTAGDMVTAAFPGFGPLLILGKTSPSAGSNTVVLQANETVIANVSLSAKSSFTEHEALLFYASDMDPYTWYYVQLTNDDGSQLDLAGFQLISPHISPTNNTAAQKYKHRENLAPIAAGIGAILFFLLILAARSQIMRQRERQQMPRKGLLVAQVTKDVVLPNRLATPREDETVVAAPRKARNSQQGVPNPFLQEIDAPPPIKWTRMTQVMDATRNQRPISIREPPFGVIAPRKSRASQQGIANPFTQELDPPPTTKWTRVMIPEPVSALLGQNTPSYARSMLLGDGDRPPRQPDVATLTSTLPPSYTTN